MTKLKIVPAKKLIRFLEEKGFSVSRQVGSHVVLIRNNITVVIPSHKGKDLGRGIIASILKNANISKDIYQNLI